MTRKKFHFQSYLGLTLRAHALSAAVSSQPTRPGPELHGEHGWGRYGLFNAAAEAQRACWGHPQARAGPGSGAEANLGSRQQSQGS